MDAKRKKSSFTPLEIKVSNRGSERRNKRFLTGFTLVELLTVLGIIALLVGLIIPALTMVRNTARETKQKAQLTTIGLTLTAFKSDYGDYPPSFWAVAGADPLVSKYCGAQKLAEALLGRDLLGFNKYSDWLLASSPIYYPTDPALLDTSLDDRIGPYLELATANAFKLGDLFGWGGGDTGFLEANTFVICDSFGAKKITLIHPVTSERITVTPGTPILYYRANTSSKTLDYSTFDSIELIYNWRDNWLLADSSGIGRMADGPPHELNYVKLYEKIIDPKASTPTFSWPYRPDSYILISAGADGTYGTGDDITNFGN